MADSPMSSDGCGSANTDVRFTIRWDDDFGEFGGYRVNVPNIEYADVVLAEHYDRLRAENERLREGGKELDGVIRRLSEENERLQATMNFWTHGYADGVSDGKAEQDGLRALIRKAHDHIDTKFGPPGSNNLDRALLDELAAAFDEQEA